MFAHPFVSSLSDKTLEELQETISSINKKIAFASRSNNQHMINQLYMVLESYRVEYNKRQDEIWNKKSTTFTNKIDIN